MSFSPDGNRYADRRRRRTAASLGSGDRRGPRRQQRQRAAFSDFLKGRLCSRPDGRYVVALQRPTPTARRPRTLSCSTPRRSHRSAEQPVPVGSTGRMVSVTPDGRTRSSWCRAPTTRRRRCSSSISRPSHRAFDAGRAARRALRRGSEQHGGTGWSDRRARRHARRRRGRRRGDRRGQPAPARPRRSRGERHVRT